MVMNIKSIKKLLIANRSEIAIRITRSAEELGIETVSIYSKEDKYALHRFKTDEAYQLSENKGPIEAYLDIDKIIEIALASNVDAIHPGYGLLSENPDFADKCFENGIIFIGPNSTIMKKFGNKVAAREAAIEAGVQVVPASEKLDVNDIESVIKVAESIGYPLMLKASWGGGGRGMREVSNEEELRVQVPEAHNEALKAFGNGEIYFEKLIRNARHVEVQIIGDTHGNLVHLFERECSMQRRNQKVVERAPAPYLSEERRLKLCESSIVLGKSVGYINAGTVEYLLDYDTNEFYFIEVNPRIQVEHTVTEQITGIDIVKSQIKIAEGYEIGDDICPVPTQENITKTGYAMQCRVTTENPENGFIPDYGKLTAYRSATGFGVRLDAGTAYPGALITPYYDSMLVKVTTFGKTEKDSIDKMKRTLKEFRIRGVSTNISFLITLLNHQKFLNNEYTTKFIDSTPELYTGSTHQDNNDKILSFIANTIVNGNKEVTGREHPAKDITRNIHTSSYDVEIPKGNRDIFLEKGADGYKDFVLNNKKPMITDTTMRDAHQSLFATRFRTNDIVKIADYYAHNLNNLYSVECWGGATFDVSMRFLNECPWERLAILREKMPNQMLQMLFRGSNAVGYKNYPDNAVKHFIERAAETGIDVFRIFDSLNWVENMKFAIDTTLKQGKIVEGTICYTSDIYKKENNKYSLDYYIEMAKELESLGSHVIALKDMAGLLKPAQATDLISALKQEVNLPIHLHTHDTSGISSSTVYNAIVAGCDIVDCAVDSMSGLTSQVNMGSILEALKNTPLEADVDPNNVREASKYWAQVRELYKPFETSMKSGASEVYHHEMPGGQFTNLKEQAKSLGIGEDRWELVSNAYADVNKLFGDIVKVTPSSKVVGDLAIMMVTSNLSTDDIIDPNKEIAFPESVISLIKGELGMSKGGFPQAIIDKVLRGQKPLDKRPGLLIDDINLVKTKSDIEEKILTKISENELSSYIMYPDVFVNFKNTQKKFSNLSCLPTYTYFFGMDPEEEITVELGVGKSIIIKYLASSEENEDGMIDVFFEVNGQPRTFAIKSNNSSASNSRQIADETNSTHIPAPMPAMVVETFVKEGDKVEKGDVLVSLEAMKMQTTVTAPHSGTVKSMYVKQADAIKAHDLLMIVE